MWQRMAKNVQLHDCQYSIDTPHVADACHNGTRSLQFESGATLHNIIHVLDAGQACL